MQLVIDIPDILMEYIVKGRDLSEEQNDEMAYAIADGTPLPKGHGRLIDEDTIAGDGSWDWSDRLDATPTIIEADTERSENDTD